MIYLIVDKKSKKNKLGRMDACDAFVTPKKKKTKKAKKNTYLVVNYKEPKCWAKRLFCL